MNAHFCFSELLILIEKKICGFSFGPLEYQKKLHIFKKYWKDTIQESCLKKVQFCTRRRKSHFFHAHLPFPLMWTCSLCVHCRTITKFSGFYKKFRGFSKLEFWWRQIMVNSIIQNHPWGHTRSHKKFGPDRFSRFEVYWIQTDRQTDK